LQVSSTAGVNV